MSEYFLGIDVSKGYADFIVLTAEQATKVEAFRLDDTRAGHQKLAELITELCRESAEVRVYAGVESTGGMEDNWLCSLHELSTSLPLKAARLNPAGVAQYVKADLTRTVTDAVSARKIAEYLIVHRRKVAFDQKTEALEALRPLWSTLTMLKKQRSQLTHNLHHMLYGALPSILLYCRRGFPQWVLAVIQKYPTAARLAAARVKTLTKIAHVSTQRAVKLKDAAKADVASHADEISAMVICSLTQQILHLDKAIAEIDKKLVSYGKKDARTQLLCSFAGIAELSAVGLLMNMPHMDSTPDAAHLASYWGLHPVFKKSGDGCMVARMSKAGRSQPRAILFMVTLAAICHNPHIRQFYRRLIYKDGWKRLPAIGVCMHKIARIVYGMLRTNTPFNPSIDRANRTKKGALSSEQAQLAKEQRKRRFLQADKSAPISKREQKKREKINGYQRTNGAENGITATSSPIHKNVLVTA